MLQEPVETAPLEIDALLARLRAAAAECGDVDLPTAPPARAWLAKGGPGDESTTGAAVAQWLVQAAHAGALAPLWLVDAEHFAALAFYKFLGRAPDAQGRAWVAERLAQHAPRTELLAEVACSPEARQLHPRAWRRWRWLGLGLHVALHAPLVGAGGRAALQWLTRGVLRRSERWLAQRARRGAWALAWGQARTYDAQGAALQQQLDAQGAALQQQLDAQGAALQQQLDAQGAALHAAQRQVRNLERGGLDDAAVEAVGQFMAAFEQRFRGSEEALRAQWACDYLPLLHALRAQVLGSEGADAPLCLDLGCGRGTWLALLRDAGFAARGVDVNPVPVAHACALGLDAAVGDALEWLRAQPAESALAVTAFHLVEHVPFAMRLALTQEAARVLRPGGVLIYETPNPENVWVGTHTFYHDPTHNRPLTPTSLAFLAEYCGLQPEPVLRLHPYPPEAAVPGDDALTARVNGMTCGAQDFALVAYQPLAQECDSAMAAD